MYNLIKDEGTPWGVGTVAIVTGLGARLIYQSLKEDDNIKDKLIQIETFFTLCDEDTRLFTNYINHQKTDINSAAVKLLNLILATLEKIFAKKCDVKNNLMVDFNMGIEYMVTSAYQLLAIFKANNYQDLSAGEIADFVYRLKEIENLKLRWEN